MNVNQLESQRGSALVLALISALLLMIVSFEVAHTVRIEDFITENLEQDTKLNVACRAGLERALARLREDRQNTEVDSEYDIWWKLFIDTELIEDDVAKDEFLLEDEGGFGAEAKTIKLYIETFDECAKFNVYNLLSEDPRERARRRDQFANVIDYFRQDTDLDLTFSDGESLADQVYEFMRRDEDTPYGQALKPPTKQDRTLADLSELLYVNGIEPSMMWDQLDEDGEKIIPGLWRFITIWSDLQININTGEMPALAGLFEQQEAFLGESIVAYRTEAAEEKERVGDRFSESGSWEGDGENAEEDPTGGAAFTQISELKEKVEGITPALYDKISAFLTVQSTTFSIIVTSEIGRIRLTKMWLVRRDANGFRILLERPVNRPPNYFPYFIQDDQIETAEEDAAEEDDF
jgi:type II secretory pathway component PulK